PETTFDYIRTRNRMNIFSIVQKEFRKSGISQVELAARMGKRADRVCRLLGAPGNWTADTASDLVFAISGGVVAYSVSYPLDAPPRNRVKPEWSEPTIDSPKLQQKLIEQQGTASPEAIKLGYGDGTSGSQNIIWPSASSQIPG